MRTRRDDVGSFEPCWRCPCPIFDQGLFTQESRVVQVRRTLAVIPLRVALFTSDWRVIGGSRRPRGTIGGHFGGRGRGERGRRVVGERRVRLRERERVGGEHSSTRFKSEAASDGNLL